MVVYYRWVFYYSLLSSVPLSAENQRLSNSVWANIEQTSSWLKQAYWNPAPWLKCRPNL